MTPKEHLVRIKDTCDQLEAVGGKVEEKNMLVILLNILPCSSYKPFIETLNNASTNIDLKCDELCTKLLQQARWRQQFFSSSDMASAK